MLQQNILVKILEDCRLSIGIAKYNNFKNGYLKSLRFLGGGVVSRNSSQSCLFLSSGNPGQVRAYTVRDSGGGIIVTGSNYAEMA